MPEAYIYSPQYSPFSSQSLGANLYVRIGFVGSGTRPPGSPYQYPSPPNNTKKAVLADSLPDSNQ